MDQTIEETVNKDTKTVGGTKGFSTKKMLLQSIISLQATVPTMRDSSDQWYQTHPNMTKERITQDERDVTLLHNMFKETWKNPFEFTSETLCCISTGVIPSDEDITDMYNAKEKGESVYQQFITERLEERAISFFPLSPV